MHSEEVNTVESHQVCVSRDVRRSAYLLRARRCEWHGQALRPRFTRVSATPSSPAETGCTIPPYHPQTRHSSPSSVGTVRRSHHSNSCSTHTGAKRDKAQMFPKLRPVHALRTFQRSSARPVRRLCQPRKAGAKIDPTNQGQHVKPAHFRRRQHGTDTWRCHTNCGSVRTTGSTSLRLSAYTMTRLRNSIAFHSKTACSPNARNKVGSTLPATRAMRSSYFAFAHVSCRH